MFIQQTRKSTLLKHSNAPCAADDDFPLPHPQVRALAARLTGGAVLDLGCGTGNNSLFLQRRGCQVSAWQSADLQVAPSAQLIDRLALSGIQYQTHCLDQVRFNGRYQAILSIDVMQQLSPSTIPQMINDMQAATVKQGYNLIVCAMNTAETPCPIDFSFTFRSGELSHYYRGWHIVYYYQQRHQLHQLDAQGNPVTLQVASLLAQKISVKNL